jgi:anti-sigma B factor antagonist
VQVGFKATQRNGWTILHVVGEIDMATAPRVRQHAIALVADGNLHLVIDLSGVDFCDSTGLGVLVAVVKRVRTAGGDLRLVTNDERLTALLELTRLDQVFDVYPRVDDATSAPQSDPA